MRVLLVPAVLAALTASTVARAHPPGIDDEGTVDEAPRRPELETRGGAPPAVAPPTAPGPGPASDVGPPPTLPERPPATLPYYPWSPIPYGYKLKMSGPRRGVLTTGVIVLGVTHVTAIAATVIVAASCKRSPCDTKAGTLWIPVVGPLFSFAGQGKDAPNGLYAGLGVAEVLGFGMIAGSMLMTDQRLVRDDKKYPLAFTSGPGQIGLGLEMKL